MFCRFRCRRRRRRKIERLRNDDDDSNENGTKEIGLDKENNNFAREHAFLYISLPPLHDYNVKLPNFTFCRGREQKKNFLFLFLNFDAVL